MTEGFLLDTNVVSELTRTSIEPKVQKWVAAQEFGSLLISVVSLVEMEKGFTTMKDLVKRERLETWLERQLWNYFEVKYCQSPKPSQNVGDRSKVYGRSQVVRLPSLMA